MKKFLFILLIGSFWVSCSRKAEKPDAYGNFEATEIIVSSEASGKVLSLLCEEGDRLDSLQIIGYIDSSDYVLKIQQLLAQRQAIQAKMENIETQIAVQEQQKANAMIEKQRIENLLKTEAATKKQYDDIFGQIKLIDKQIANIQSQKLSLASETQVIEKQEEQAELNLKRCRITAPISGTVLNKIAQTGELVTPGKPIFKMADLSKMYLRVYVSQNQLSTIKIGQKVKVFIDMPESKRKELTGQISWISSQAEFTPKIIQTREERVNLVYAVKISVPNDGSLKIGMPGDVIFSNP